MIFVDLNESTIRTAVTGFVPQTKNLIEFKAESFIVFLGQVYQPDKQTKVRRSDVPSPRKSKIFVVLRTQLVHRIFRIESCYFITLNRNNRIRLLFLISLMYSFFVGKKHSSRTTVMFDNRVSTV